VKHTATLIWLIPLIGVLACFAAGMGLFWPNVGEPVTFTSHRGEQVVLAGEGLYRYDTVSMASQTRANDTITLVLGVPLLALGAWLAFRGSLRGHLLLTGTLGYFLYTYTSMAFLATYNELFLVYTLLYSLSLIAFILSMLAFDHENLPGRFSATLPRRSITGLLFFAGAFLVLAWLGRIVPPLIAGETPPLENTTTLVIQALDLGLIVPLCFLGAVLLLQRKAWGYLLASIALMKMLTMGAAVSAMAFNMVLAGVLVSPIELVVFPGLTLANAVLALRLLGSIDAQGDERQAQPGTVVHLS
jgi:hypothetical protein